MGDAPLLVYGIDLGTTFSCIACIDDTGHPAVIPNAEGERTTPSAVFFDGDRRIVGREAKSNAALHPDRVVEMVKRQMGRREWTFFYQDEEYTPEEISSYILRKVVGDAERRMGRAIRDVVITCPAYFGVNEREATARAGEIAGLNVRSIINEPTAAAIAYGLESQGDQVVMVYDLGGGTFDVTLIELRQGKITVIATGGDYWLGGRNWDEALVTYLADSWMRVSGAVDNPLDEPGTLQDLLGRAEQAKIALATSEWTDVAVSHHGRREMVRVTREKFDELTAHLVERSIEYSRRMLAEAARKGFTHFDQILLVGGATRMRQVQRRLQETFHLQPKIYDPDEAVARGAAWYGQRLASGKDVRRSPPARRAEAQTPYVAVDAPFISMETKITNVTSRSFGVAALERGQKEIVRNLIRVNESAPAQATQRFGTLQSNQSSAEIRIMENLSPEENVAPADCEEIGNAVLSLPPGLPADAPIEITFEINEQGRLHAQACELSANRSIEVEIHTGRVLSGDQLERARQRSRQIVVW